MQKTPQVRCSLTRALPVHPVVKAYGVFAIVYSTRHPKSAADLPVRRARDDFEGNLLALVEGAQAGAFPRRR